MDKDLMREISQMEGDRKQDFAVGPEDNTKKPKNPQKEGKRKSQGLKNPFLIFAKEQRSNIKTCHKGHSSRVLGNMWHELESSEKKKYFEKAKRPYSEVDPPDVLTSGKSKSRNQTKKKKEPKPDASENGVSSSQNESAGILEKKENRDSSGVEAQSVYRFPRSQAEMSPYSSYVGGFYRPSFYPPDPLWMYHQAMIPPYYPLASHCHCCPLSFRGYGPPSSHFRSVIYERTNALSSSVSSYAGNDDDENRLVIVDDDDEQA